jgi:inosose dehydratase
MSIKVGCFALINPFQVLVQQLEQIKSWGFHYADITDNTDGACLGAEFGFTSVASLDANPFDIKRMFEANGLTITSVCAHANLLDPTAPWRYGTAQIIKAVRLAATIGVEHVVTTEGEPSTTFGKSLTNSEAIYSIKEKLYEPLRLAEDLGVKLLLEPHGHITDSVEHMERLIDACNSEALGVNLDTGNLWLGGGEPLHMIERLGSKIGHVHWKDMPEEMRVNRGKIFGCGMAVIPLGSGVVGIKEIYEALVAIGFDGHTTLEVAGEQAVLKSYEYLQSLEKKLTVPEESLLIDEV